MKKKYCESQNMERDSWKAKLGEQYDVQEKKIW